MRYRRKGPPGTHPRLPVRLTTWRQDRTGNTFTDESDAVIEARYTAALADIKRRRPFPVDVRWASTLTRFTE